MSRNCYLNILLSILALTCISSQAHAADKVVLQLKWEHEFQFAGYYAALWQGYYEREGLEVEIRSAATPDGRFLSPVDELASGHADFAIGGADIFLYQGQGRDLKVLAPIFQRSPSAMFALENQTIHTVEQASRLRIAAIASDDTHLETRAMFFMNGVDPDRVNFVDAPVSLDSLVSDKAEAVVTYGISARIRADELGLTLNTLSSSDHGIQFYGDTLYTRGQLARENPELVERFLKASLNGWRYALEHRPKIAERISRTLPRYVYHYDDFEAYNKAFAQLIDEYTFYPAVELGHIDHKRWQRTYDILERLGEIEQPYDPISLLFSKTPSHAYSFSILGWTAAALLILALLLLSWRSKRNLGWQLSVLAMVLLVEQGLETWHYQEDKARRSIEVLERLATVRSKLEQVLARNLAELSGVAAFIAANPEMDQAKFNNYATNILKLDPQLINLAAAPDLIVRYVYPRRGNEAVIGLDYRTTPDQLPAVMHAIESNEPIIAGPVNLVQGNHAFIGRAPVSLIDDNGLQRNWGVVSAPIDVASVYREAGLLDPELGLKVAIRGKDGSGSGGETFYGRQNIFHDPRAVTQTVSFGGGSWQIAAVDAMPGSAVSPRLMLIRGAASIFALLLLLLLTTQRRNQESQRHYQSILRRHAEFLREVETVAKVGGWRIDQTEVISEISEQARSMLNLAPSIKDINIDTFAKRLMTDNDQDVAQTLREALHTGERIDLEVKLSDGRSWFRLIGDPLHDGQGSWEIVGAIQDITEKKIADAKIERQANYDNLTDLPNRALFRDRLETAMSLALRTRSSIALLFVDLDNFKSINDNYGHKEGDLVLAGNGPQDSVPASGYQIPSAVTAEMNSPSFCTMWAVIRQPTK
ncbi:MAG: ABC transporter substrate-binding protein [Porticoccaceae bacterium]